MSCGFGAPIKFEFISKITSLLTFPVRFSLSLSENGYFCSAKCLNRLVSEWCSTFFVHYSCHRKKRNIALLVHEPFDSTELPVQSSARGHTVGLIFWCNWCH